LPVNPAAAICSVAAWTPPQPPLRTPPSHSRYRFLPDDQYIEIKAAIRIACFLPDGRFLDFFEDAEIGAALGMC
jgi:hypothetical protein